MSRIKKGDIVGRISYGKDILFIVDRIIKINNKQEIAILKGITLRIKADSKVEDLEIIDKRIVDSDIEKFENRIQQMLKKCMNKLEHNEEEKRIKKLLYTGKILHLDGDRRYSEKSNKYYKGLGLNVIVKNIAENRQPKFVKMLLQKYRPDILVITGHDRNDKKWYRVPRYI